MTTGLDVLREEVARRVRPERLAHIESVASTAAEIAAAGGWPEPTLDASIRSAWIHDALKDESFTVWLRAIELVGWEPDPWALTHARQVLHAQAAAAWARGRGESDSEVLEAVRHHPTGHRDWGVVGRILYVADFTEPTRRFARAVGSARLRRRAREGDEGLAETALEILTLRIGHLLLRGRPVHPASIDAWNAWTERARE